jgi:hypothetical protein
VMKIRTCKTAFAAMSPSPIYEAVAELTEAMAEFAEAMADPGRSVLLKQPEEINGSLVAPQERQTAERHRNEFQDSSEK